MKIRSNLLVIPTFACMVGVSCAGPSGTESALRIGISEVNYKPEIGLDMVGNYRGDDYASRGVHDSLYARALVADGSNGAKAALVTVDNCYLHRDAVEFIRKRVASQTDIPPGHIMVMATHTHSGPTSDLGEPGVGEYLERVAKAVIEAEMDLKPSRLFYGKNKEERISFNRRLLFKDGTVHMSWEDPDPDLVEKVLGPKDADVIAVTVEQDGKETGSIINFGCHPTTLTGDNWLYSADFPAYMVESMRKVKGDEYIPMFFNGCCGNVTQIDYRVGFISTFQECQRIGYMLGVSALEAIDSQEPVKGDRVVVSREFVPLKPIGLSDEQVEWAHGVMARVEREGMPPLQKDGIPDALYAQWWLDLHERRETIDSLEVMAVRIGQLAFIGFPGEMFAEFGMKVKAESPTPYTLVMGIANDYRSYFPTEVSFTQGPEGFTPMITGYETTPGTTRYEIGSGEKLTSSALRQLRTLFHEPANMNR